LWGGRSPELQRRPNWIRRQLGVFSWGVTATTSYISGIVIVASCRLSHH
jgi:hypothetical protein